MKNFTAQQLRNTTVAIAITSLVPTKSLCIMTLPEQEEIGNWLSVDIHVGRYDRNIEATLLLEQPERVAEVVRLPVETLSMLAEVTHVRIGV